MNGIARIDYNRDYVLFHADYPHANRVITDLMTLGYRLTCGFSADDAGIGVVFVNGEYKPLNRRRVFAVGDFLWGDTPTLKEWFDHHYSGCEYYSCNGSPRNSVVKIMDIVAGGDGTFAWRAWPTEYIHITQPFGARPEYYGQYNLPGHEGIDIKALHGTQIKSVAPGTVVDIHNDDNKHNYGTFVRVDHLDGYQTTYAHMHSINVHVGQYVTAGHLLGTADNTGNSDASHLHITLKHKWAFSGGETYIGYPHNIVDPTRFVDDYLRG